MTSIAPSSARAPRRPAPWTLANQLKVALLGGMALVLMLSFQVPLFPSAPFLTYDLSDVPALVAGFALGPLHGCAVVLLKNLLFMAQRPVAVEWVGVPMNTLAGCTLVGTSALFYWRRKTRVRAALALLLGTLAMAVVMIPANMLVYPLVLWLLGAPGGPPVLEFVLAVVTPFNLIKGAVSGTLTFLVYKRLSNLLKRF